MKLGENTLDADWLILRRDFLLFLDTKRLFDIKEIISTGLPTAEGIAVDWIGDHIYWVESGLDIIEVADLDGNNRSTIISSSAEHPMENPRSIALDPRAG